MLPCAMFIMDQWLNRVICGNSAQELKRLPGECVHLTVTSPPYDKLRDYEGYVFDEETLDIIIKELHRVLIDGGVVVWVVNDMTVDGSESGESFRQALRFKESGFNIHDTMIYLKNSFANPSRNRYHQVFEYMFVFSKGSPVTFNAIMDRKNKSSHSGPPSIRMKDGSLLKRGQCIQHKRFGTRFNVWEYVVGKGHSSEDDIAYDHPAIFPESLARDHIYSWSNPGDVVLDPFCGSGTTLKMAYLMNRSYIGMDISEEYCRLARMRVNNYQGQQKPPSYWKNKMGKNVRSESIDKFF